MTPARGFWGQSWGLEKASLKEESGRACFGALTSLRAEPLVPFFSDCGHHVAALLRPAFPRPSTHRQDGLPTMPSPRPRSMWHMTDPLGESGASMIVRLPGKQLVPGTAQSVALCRLGCVCSLESMVKRDGYCQVVPGPVPALVLVAPDVLSGGPGAAAQGSVGTQVLGTRPGYSQRLGAALWPLLGGHGSSSPETWKEQPRVLGHVACVLCKYSPSYTFPPGDSHAAAVPACPSRCVATSPLLSLGIPAWMSLSLLLSL